MSGALHFQRIMEQAQRVGQNATDENSRLGIISGILGNAGVHTAAALMRREDFDSAYDLILLCSDTLMGLATKLMEDPSTVEGIAAFMTGADKNKVAQEHIEHHTIESANNVPLPIGLLEIGTPEEIERAAEIFAQMNIVPMPSRVHLRTIGDCFFDESCDRPVTHNPIFVPGPEDGPGDFHTVKIDDCCTHHATILASLCALHVQPKSEAPPSSEASSPSESKGRLTQQELDDMLCESDSNP